MSKNAVRTRLILLFLAILATSIFMQYPNIAASNLAAPQFALKKSVVCDVEYAYIIVSNPFFDQRPWTAEYYNPFRKANVSITAPSTSPQAQIKIKPEQYGTFLFRLISINGVDIKPIDASLTIVKAIESCDITTSSVEEDPYRIKYSVSVKRHCSSGTATAQWYFSDGETASGMNVSHTYKFGVSNFDAEVKVTASNDDLSKSMTASKNVPLPSMPMRQYKLDRNEACTEEKISIIASDLALAAGKEWGFQYSIDASEKITIKCTNRRNEISIGKLEVGEHTIQIYDLDGKSETELAIVVKEPFLKTPKITAEESSTGTVLSANLQMHKIGEKLCHAPFIYTWDYGDNSEEVRSEKDSVTHLFSKDGEYPIKLSAVSGIEKVNVAALLKIKDGKIEMLSVATAQEMLDLPTGFGSTFFKVLSSSDDTTNAWSPAGKDDQANVEKVIESASFSVLNVIIVALSLSMLAITFIIRLRSKIKQKSFDFSLVEVIAAVMLLAMSALTTDFSQTVSTFNSYSIIFMLGFALQTLACGMNFYNAKSAKSARRVRS